MDFLKSKRLILFLDYYYYLPALDLFPRGVDNNACTNIPIEGPYQGVPGISPLTPLQLPACTHD